MPGCGLRTGRWHPRRGDAHLQRSHGAGGLRSARGLPLGLRRSADVRLRLRRLLRAFLSVRGRRSSELHGSGALRGRHAAL